MNWPCLLALLVLLFVLSASNRVGDPFVSARISDQPSMESVNRFLAQGVDPFDPEGEVIQNWTSISISLATLLLRLTNLYEAVTAFGCPCGTL